MKKKEKSLALKANGLRHSLLILLAFWLSVIIRLLIVEVAAIKKLKSKTKFVSPGILPEIQYSRNTHERTKQQCL